MRRADRRGRLVSRAHTDIATDGNGVRVIDLFGDDTQAAGGPRQFWVQLRPLLVQLRQPGKRVHQGHHGGGSGEQLTAQNRYGLTTQANAVAVQPDLEKASALR